MLLGITNSRKTIETNGGEAVGRTGLELLKALRYCWGVKVQVLCRHLEIAALDISNTRVC
jgi:hypothetical protein